MRSGCLGCFFVPHLFSVLFYMCRTLASLSSYGRVDFRANGRAPGTGMRDPTAEDVDSGCDLTRRGNSEQQSEEGQPSRCSYGHMLSRGTYGMIGYSEARSRAPSDSRGSHCPCCHPRAGHECLDRVAQLSPGDSLLQRTNEAVAVRDPTCDCNGDVRVAVWFPEVLGYGEEAEDDSHGHAAESSQDNSAGTKITAEHRMRRHSTRHSTRYYTIREARSGIDSLVNAIFKLGT